MISSSTPLVVAHGLSMSYQRPSWFSRQAPDAFAVRDVDIAVNKGEIVGVVGESGSGKSTLGRLLMGLERRSGGHILFDGQDLPHARSDAFRPLRKRIQMVFQDPYGSLDPRRRVGGQIEDGLTLHRPELDRDARKAEVQALLERVGLPADFSERMPHQLSGGQRQRVAIARALAPQPDFIVADEPVSALDVSIQGQIVGLFAKLRRELGLAVLFISHDLHVVRHLCDRVAVMQNGRIVEQAETEALFRDPKADYTRILMDATPVLPVL